MSARFASDRPRNARVAWLTSDRIIASFAIRVTNGMNRREINDIEPHCLGVIDPWQTIAESRSAITLTFCRAREKFIPCANQRRWTLDNDAGNWSVLRRIGAVG